MGKAFLYSTERSVFLKLLSYLLVISVSCFFISIFAFGINVYNLVLLIAPSIFIFGYSFFNKKVDIIGEIVFNKDYIQLNYYKGEDKEYKISDLRKVIIEYRGYDGRNDSSLLNPFLINGGLNNEIILYKKDGQKLSIDFYLDNLRSLKNIVYVLKRIVNLKIEIIESNTRKKIYRNY